MRSLVDRLNKRITLQKKTVVKGDGGRPITTYIDWVTVWAAVEPLQGREYFAAAGVNAESTIRVRIRYRQGVTSDMRVKYGSRVLEIESPPIDPGERHEEIQLMCKELVSGGG